MNHHCHAIGCPTPCPPEFLMCRPHWKMVPLPLQRDVWNHYRVGQCDDKNPSGEWMIAAERAIVAVAVREKRLTPAQAQERVERELARFGHRLETTVVNKDHGEPYDVYIGRGSIFGNPYTHVRSQHRTIAVSSRDEAIARYKRWVLGLESVAFATRPTRDQVLALRGKRLGCHCKPENCHGDVLVELIAEHDRHVEENNAEEALSGSDHVHHRGADVGSTDGDPAVGTGSVFAPEGEDRAGVHDDRGRAGYADDEQGHQDEEDDALEPPLKWVGGKRWAAKHLAGLVMQRLTIGARYIEPFFGSGAVALALPTGTKMLLSDLCAPLMGLWWWIKNRPKDLDFAMGSFEEDWTINEENYYRIRDAFNALPFSTKDPLPAARFLWLNKTSYNGVYRENKAGKYNVPWGKKMTVNLPSFEHIEALSHHLESAQILMGVDFEAALRQARPGDVVFVDPPYDGVYDDYLAGGFGVEGQVRLARVLDQLVGRGVHVFMTNNDTDRIRELYNGWDIEPFEEPRTISCKATSRTKAPCLLVSSPIRVGE